MSENYQNTTEQHSASSTNVSEIWHRVGHVEITLFKGSQSKTYNFEGLDFKFNVSQILGRVPEGNMTVSICNLSQDTANEIITLCNVQQALKERKTLKLYAGYADPNNDKYKGELIAVMDIINATITTPPPDVWLQITGVYAAWLNDRTFAIDIMDLTEIKEKKGIVKTVGMTTWGHSQVAEYDKKTRKAKYLKISQVLKEICKGLNELSEYRQSKFKYTYDLTRVAPHWKMREKDPESGETKEVGKTRRFAFVGTLAEIPTKVAEYFKVLCMWEYRDNDTLCLMVYPDPKYIARLTEEEKKLKVNGRLVKFLDIEHGLIGIPKLKDSIKLECRCFLDGRIQAGDYVSVRSQMVPVIYEFGQPIKTGDSRVANSWDDRGNETVKVYQIMKIKYSGHLRGNQWYCDIEARRPELVEQRIEEVKPQVLWLTEDMAKYSKGWKYNEETGDMIKLT